MTRSDFYKLLADPSALNEGTIAGLKQLTQDYPYAAPLRLLLVKNLKETEDLSFETELQNAAALTSDRRKLYTLLYQPKIQQIVEALDEPIVTVEKATAKALEPEATPLEQEILKEALITGYQLEMEPQTDQEPMTPKSVSPAQKSSSTGPKSRTDWLDLLEGNQTAGDDQSSSGDLIDQFISNDKGGVPAPAFFSATDMARLSLVDDEEFVTETLAKIYLEQELYDKAINAYKKLALKFPEKSSYFGALQQEAEAKKAEN